MHILIVHAKTLNPIWYVKIFKGLLANFLSLNIQLCWATLTLFLWHEVLSSGSHCSKAMWLSEPVIKPKQSSFWALACIMFLFLSLRDSIQLFISHPFNSILIRKNPITYFWLQQSSMSSYLQAEKDLTWIGKTPQDHLAMLRGMNTWFHHKFPKSEILMIPRNIFKTKQNICIAKW